MNAATVEQLLAVAKEWTPARFAAAQSSRFVLPAHRFEPSATGFRRSALADSEPNTLEFEQEVIEILAMDGEAVLAEAATVVRVPGLGVCLGPFPGPESD